ncbi:pyridoxal-5'-phosphate-dependent protein subunit beta [Candidatus Heimdallarchaeota archaeon B3_Heim]|nr:MAG: pyridoxal-5'-phosphate-dependent protein subunit beta [Candidatus Heimdallarchaeota archaeon B3_Heim]
MVTNPYNGLTLQEVQTTLSKIRPYVLRTPIIRGYALEALIDKKTYYKLEYLQPTRSFKVRGACSKVLSLEHCEGVVTASGGNHGLAVSYICKELKIPAIVYLPANTTKTTIESIKFWGGTPVLHGSSWDEADVKAQEYSQEMELPYVHAFDDLAVVRGQGTTAIEMLNEQSDLDAIFVSVGGGGLISGVGMVAKQMKPEVHIYGVETIGAHAVTQSFKSGKIKRLAAITSIAKTLGAQQTTEDTLARIKVSVNDMQTVTDQSALNALKFLLDEEKILVEPATSCIVAALLDKKFDLSPYEKIGIILCGANVSLRELQNWNVI